jgi:hypothetical protein
MYPLGFKRLRMPGGALKPSVPFPTRMMMPEARGRLYCPKRLPFGHKF